MKESQGQDIWINVDARTRESERAHLIIWFYSQDLNIYVCWGLMILFYYLCSFLLEVGVFTKTVSLLFWSRGKVYVHLTFVRLCFLNRILLVYLVWFGLFYSQDLNYLTLCHEMKKLSHIWGEWWNHGKVAVKFIKSVLEIG